ncbi:MAG TPA: hydrolase Nlp/P60, partial [Actinomycetes bacterium]
LALLPLRIAVRLGLRGPVVAVCLLVLAVLGYGIAGDLGLLDPPANAAAGLSRTARADIPPQYRRHYQRAARRCPGLPWTVLAAVGKVESDHGRARLPGVRAGANPAGAAGPMQLGVGGKAGPTWQHYRVDADGDGASVYDPADATAAAADKLCADGAPRHLDAALYAYNPSWAYVTRVNRWAARYTSGGGGRR